MTLIIALILPAALAGARCLSYDHQGEIDAEPAWDESADERYERRKTEDLTRRLER